MIPGELLSSVQAHVRDLLGEDDPEFVADLVETFAATAEDAVADAEAAASGPDAVALAAAAHTLKGSAANIGLADLAGRWDGVEIAARQGHTPVESVRRAAAQTRAAVGGLAAAV